jgi:coronin-1B/1C/6
MTRRCNTNYLQEVKAHEGAKPAQAVYCKNDKIFTAGFSRMSARQYALWDEVYIFFSLFSTNIS